MFCNDLSHEKILILSYFYLRSLRRGKGGNQGISEFLKWWWVVKMTNN